MKKRKPTQNDVAVEANVSQGLVSLILSNAEVEIADATRERVLEAAARLGYTPRGRASREKKPKVRPPAPKPRSGKVIAYIPPVVRRNEAVDGSVFDGYDELYDRMQNRLVELAYHQDCSVIVRPGENPAELTGWLIEWGVDGVILHSNNPTLATWIARRYPLVQLNRRVISEADVVMSNQEELMLMALNYLREHGHQRIAYATATSREHVLRQRKQTYFDYMQDAGLPIFDVFLECEKPETLASLYFSLPPAGRPTAVIAGDPSALILQKEALKKGLSLPRDLSVIGIDNITADVFAHPPLTSIDIRIEEVARVALRLILERIDDPSQAFQKIEITPRLVTRESVAPPASNLNLSRT